MIIFKMISTTYMQKTDLYRDMWWRKKNTWKHKNQVKVVEIKMAVFPISRVFFLIYIYITESVQLMRF